ncbi:MAG: type II toxin-antitoxin system PemK/MazF family toxin [Candidatus Aenigmarchaeota archaeon]|nr:type II toxin-antitoxin system PemK/MazF family toxin [Candidatus Aenigmarchaeota archaeon]
MEIRRGDIFLVNLDPVIGSEQGKTRPAVVIQNDIGNRYSPVTIVAAMTSRIFEKEFPTNVFVPKEESGLSEDSTILLNQIRTVDTKRLVRKIGRLSRKKMKEVDEAIKISLGIIEP